MKPKLLPLGDSALLIQFGTEIDLETNQRLHTLDALLRAELIPGIIEMVPAYATLLVHYDPFVLTYAKISDWINAEMERVESSASRKPRRIEVPVQYGGASGPDLEWVAAHHHLSIADTIHLHTRLSLHGQIASVIDHAAFGFAAQAGACWKRRDCR